MLTKIDLPKSLAWLVNKWCCWHYTATKNSRRKGKRGLLSFSPDMTDHIILLTYIQWHLTIPWSCPTHPIPSQHFMHLNLNLFSWTMKLYSLAKSLHSHNLFYCQWTWRISCPRDYRLPLTWQGTPISCVMDWLWPWTWPMAHWIHSCRLWSAQCLVWERWLRHSHSVAFSPWVF